jgi:5-methylcytosine-specific restriction endonuclease McrA
MATNKPSPYSSRWQKARAGYLARHPLCRDHEQRGLYVPATVVDHITPHKGDMQLFWNKANWQPLCAACHNSAKQRLEKSGKVAGCDADGFPLDAKHHWRTP